jgi:hypothetical protein
VPIDREKERCFANAKISIRKYRSTGRRYGMPEGDLSQKSFADGEHHLRHFDVIDRGCDAAARESAWSSRMALRMRSTTASPP